MLYITPSTISVPMPTSTQNVDNNQLLTDIPCYRFCHVEVCVKLEVVVGSFCELDCTKIKTEWAQYKTLHSLSHKSWIFSLIVLYCIYSVQYPLYHRTQSTNSPSLTIHLGSRLSGD